MRYGNKKQTTPGGSGYSPPGYATKVSGLFGGTRFFRLRFLCNIVEGARIGYRRKPHTLVVKNQFGYNVWDGCEVLEHLMIIPKKHRDTLASFTKQELDEWVKTCAEYELKGYSLYTRSQDNITRSIFAPSYALYPPWK